ncbi:hypothetical protein PGT21_023149 [Puccinia graminis f. sp. tritici]|uniref:Uncharacterized protein n=1 Tax=Puccinia graminis f. sp. tritici TaxID=56615 RepID=A0A5B0QTS3_PUCGR|nr:hypothetical protein PGT21_023149 [Puccinia graminis f. sp. tritici]KAA1121636.1 hypothetical protein PGTUg99_007901 [Puccinia graminis f. sp. tritici]
MVWSESGQTSGGSETTPPGAVDHRERAKPGIKKTCSVTPDHEMALLSALCVMVFGRAHD